jgi:hypothetical protein
MRNLDGNGEQTHYVKRVLLPSGKTIEVVYFRESAPVDQLSQAPERIENPAAEPHQDLHVCMECSSQLVYPVEWEESGTENWSVLLHCPNCDIYRHDRFSDEALDRLDEQLDRASAELADAYRGWVHINMTEEAERFVAALGVDAILPEDF